MASVRCPNCGGYKSYPWPLGIVNLAVLIGISLFVTALLPPAGLILLAGSIWQFVANLRKRPKGRRPYGCHICGYGWDAAAPAAAVGAGGPASPDLRQMGEVLLQQQAQAAAAAEEQERQRRMRDEGF